MLFKIIHSIDNADSYYMSQTNLHLLYLEDRTS